VPIDGPPYAPLPHNVTGPFRRNPGLTHYSEMLITDDLKYTAIRCLYKPGSHVEKLRVRRSRSGAENVLISLDIPIAYESGPPRPEYYAFEIPVRVSSPFFPRRLSSSYRASDYRKTFTTTRTLPVTHLLLTIEQVPREEIPALYSLECQAPKTLRIAQVATSTTLTHMSTSFA
jgi:hypothetical protein